MFVYSGKLGLGNVNVVDNDVSKLDWGVNSGFFLVFNLWGV